MSGEAKKMQREILLLHRKAWNVVADRMDVALSCATVAHGYREITGSSFSDLMEELEANLESAREQRDAIIDRLNTPDEAEAEA